MMKNDNTNETIINKINSYMLIDKISYFSWLLLFFYYYCYTNYSTISVIIIFAFLNKLMKVRSIMWLFFHSIFPSWVYLLCRDSVKACWRRESSWNPIKRLHRPVICCLEKILPQLFPNNVISEAIQQTSIFHVAKESYLTQ